MLCVHRNDRTRINEIQKHAETIKKNIGQLREACILVRKVGEMVIKYLI